MIEETLHDSDRRNHSAYRYHGDTGCQLNTREIRHLVAFTAAGILLYRESKKQSYDAASAVHVDAEKKLCLAYLAKRKVYIFSV